MAKRKECIYTCNVEKEILIFALRHILTTDKEFSCGMVRDNITQNISKFNINDLKLIVNNINNAEFVKTNFLSWDSFIEYLNEQIKLKEVKLNGKTN